MKFILTPNNPRSDIYTFECKKDNIIDFFINEGLIKSSLHSNNFLFGQVNTTFKFISNVSYGLPIKIKIENGILFLELYFNNSSTEYSFLINKYGFTFENYPKAGIHYKECFKIGYF